MDGAGHATTRTIEGFGQVIQEVSPESGTRSYWYGSTAGGNYGIGRLTLVTDETGGAAFTYDAQGRVVQELKVIQGQSYIIFNLRCHEFD